MDMMTIKMMVPIESRKAGGVDRSHSHEKL